MIINSISANYETNRRTKPSLRPLKGDNSERRSMEHPNEFKINQKEPGFLLPRLQ
jgi:hypothetical protein